MRFFRFLPGLITLAGIPVFAAPQHACLPTCNSTDGRFLSIAESHLSTLFNSDLNIELVLAGNIRVFRFGIFDGDAGGHWDSPDALTEITYSLYADPGAHGTGALLVRQWRDTDLADNGWTTFTLDTTNAARGKNGFYYYHLLVHARAKELGWTNFKVRIDDGSLYLLPGSLAFAAVVFTWDDVFTLYPAYPDLSTTTYDGAWSFFLAAETPQDRIEIWDGDLDFGSADCQARDTDDPNTPNDLIPPWADGSFREGVAMGEQRACGMTTGAPVEDNDFAPYVRSPNVTYLLYTPDDETFVNDNPSGNCEWELFAIDTNPDAEADQIATHLSEGTYWLYLEGLDLTNLAMLRLPLPLLGVDDNGSPVPMLPPWIVNGLPKDNP